MEGLKTPRVNVKIFKMNLILMDSKKESTCGIYTVTINQNRGVSLSMEPLMALVVGLLASCYYGAPRVNLSISKRMGDTSIICE